jgi:hypothetical protein
VRAEIGRCDVGEHRAVEQERHVVTAAAELARLLAAVLAQPVDDHAIHGVVERREGVRALAPLRGHVGVALRAVLDVGERRARVVIDRAGRHPHQRGRERAARRLGQRRLRDGSRRLRVRVRARGPGARRLGAGAACRDRSGEHERQHAQDCAAHRRTAC